MPLTIPHIYRPPHGIPLYWRDEVSGVLPAAVNAYLDHRIEATPISTDQLRLVREYFIHYINAPCWDHKDAGAVYAAELLDLRMEAGKITSSNEAARFIEHCLDLGLDPL